MRIALVSFEYPPAVGGIGTYTWHAARMLRTGGHDVEVFAGGGPAGVQLDDGVPIVRAGAADRNAFRGALVAPFLERHHASPFAVLEVPEFGAEAAELVNCVPSVPRIVRLHTPSFLIRDLNRERPTLAQRLRFALGAARRGRITWLREPPSVVADEARERAEATRADWIVSPTRALLSLARARWRLDPGQCEVCPNVFTPESALLAAGERHGNPRIVFVGRLEVRKGVIDLARAIPQVLRGHPQARFIFVGPSMPLSAGADTETWIRRHLRRHATSIEFTGRADRREVGRQLATADVAVFPSRWENFPNACLEAMSAGCAVVASSAGGMAEIIEHGRSGVLIAPRNPLAIAQAIARLLSDAGERRELGGRARERVLSAFSLTAVLPRQIAGYEAAIRLARARHERLRSSRILRS